MKDYFEWAQVAPDLRVVADADRAFVQRASSDAPEPRGRRHPTPAPDVLERVTRSLLDGAVASAFGSAEPEAVPPLTQTRWVWRLAGLFHLTHSTPFLLGVAAVRFGGARRTALAAWARKRAREERSHDVLALRDIAALGYPADRIVAALRPPMARRLLAEFESSVFAHDPIACVGYAYALERLAMTVDASVIEGVEAVIPAGVRATRCLRVHSGIGSDADHVADTIEVLATLSVEERRTVAVTAHRTTRLCLERPPCGHFDDDTIQALINAA